MDLDKIAVRLRPRTPYEAVDLGFVLVREFWRPLLMGWLAGALPFFVGAALIMWLTPLFWLPLFALWWLKPLFDRIALFVLSRGFFGDLPPMNRTLGYALRGWRTWATLSDITWRRFNPMRSVAMPVRELEQLRGGAARERLNLLCRREVRLPGIMLAAVGFCVEWVLLIASVLLLIMVIPDASGIRVGDQLVWLFEGWGASPFIKIYILAMYFICMVAVETIYVAGGLGLYINRRVGLEGWDIELTFRRLARRLRQRSRALSRAAIILWTGAALFLSANITPGHAQPNPAEVAGADRGADLDQAPAPADDFDAQHHIAEILKDPIFGHDKTEKRWQIREDLFDDKTQKDDSHLPNSLLGAVAFGAEILIWIIVALSIIFALYFLVKYLKPHEASRPESAPDMIAPPVYEAVEPVRHIALPDDIVAAAMAAWQRGEHTESLSLLYRGTIRGLARGYRIEVAPSMTARQSIQMVREAGGPVEFIGELAAAWTQLVYAGRTIADEDAARLFASWKDHFSAAERPATKSTSPGTPEAP